jgi:hypothetical protein
MPNQHRIAFIVLTLTLILSACGLPGTDLLPASTQTISSTATPPVPTTPDPVISTVPPAPTDVPIPLPTALQVIITASTGDINIRRGPGVGYNSIGALLKDQFSVASARDYRGDWLFVSIPGQTDKFGWVNTQTKYSIVTGDVMALSVLSVDPPKMAYFRNCTFRPMRVDPGGVVIPGQNEAPLNVVPFYPGDYIIKDGMAPGTPEVMEATLLEGYTIDIRTDAIPNTYACP